MYSLYYTDNDKKSYIRGLWSDKGKVYFDNIHIKSYRDNENLKGDISKLFLKGEKAVFYNEQKGVYPDFNFTGYIIDNSGNKKILYNRHFFKREKISIKEVKTLLNKYGGLTIYKYKNYAYIEIYY